MPRPVVPVVRTLLVVLLLAGISSGQALGAPAELVVAVRNPAGVFVTSGEKGLQGFDMELLERFTAWHRTRYGGELTVRAIEVATINELLDRTVAKECDLALGSITITEERAKRVAFSSSYLPIRMVLFARTGRIPEGDYRTTLRGKTLGAIAGSTGVTRIGELRQEIPQLEQRSYPDYESLFAALLGPSAEIDGVVTDVTHYWVLSAKQSLTLVAPMSEAQGLGLVLPKGSPWLSKVDTFLGEFRSSPGYFQLVRRYFGKEAADMLMFSKQGS